MIKTIYTCILLPLLFFNCCSTYVQSSNNIAHFNVEVIPYDESLLLCKITGKSMDSALYIKSYEIDYNKEQIHIYIKKSLNKTCISYPHYIQFIIPATANRVYLGDSELIWKRK